MYRILTASKDTYITNRIVEGDSKENSNVGAAGTINLFKLFKTGSAGQSKEISRALIKFDLSTIQELSASNKINLDDSSFKCFMKMFDVYGGQVCPSNFTLNVYPMSRSWDEGFGKDINYQNDYMATNWITASYNSFLQTNVLWHISGANSGGQADVDYINEADYGSGYVTTLKTQLFEKGTEDLYIDVTDIIRGTVNEVIPDEGFRISFTPEIESDEQTYFVKRLASRTAYTKEKHPRLVVLYDDSVISDQGDLCFDQNKTIYLYNSVSGVRTNLISGSSQLTGSNTLHLRLESLQTDVSGSPVYTSSFSGSYVSTGTYSSIVNVSYFDDNLKNLIDVSGSLEFKQIWCSIDETVPYYTGSNLLFNRTSISNDPIVYQKYIVKINGTKSDHIQSETSRFRVYAYEVDNMFVKAKRKAYETASKIIRTAYYSVRDVITGEVWIPFEISNNATKMSTDSKGMYFDIDMSSLPVGGLYVFDVKFVLDEVSQTFRNVSSTFRVVRN